MVYNEKLTKKVNVLKKSIYFFKQKFENKTYKFYTTDEKSYVVTFDPTTFLRLSHLDDTVKKKDKRNETVKDLNKIFRILCNGELHINKKAFERSVMHTSYMSSLVNFDIDHVHSFIEIRDKKYVLIKNKISNVVVKIERENEDEDSIYFKVKSVCNPKILNRDVTISDIEVDLPYMVEKYVDGNVTKQEIKEADVEQRKELLIDYVYFDKDGYDREENAIFEVNEFMNRVPVPIIKE